MFQSCDKIIEMELTRFETYQVSEMLHMFDEQKLKIFKYI